MGHTHPPIIVISGSIGCGKGTIIHALHHELGLAWVSTHTTRSVRPDDDVLSRRIFETEATFLRHMARGEFIETTELAGHRYGLLRQDLQQELNHGHPVVVELTVDGGMKLARLYQNVLLIFVATDEKLRRERIVHRHIEKHEQESLMKQSHHELKIARDHYDYLIENTQTHPEDVIDAIKDIILEDFPQLKGTH